MDCLNVMFDGYDMADEAYKAGSASEHGIYQTYELALYFYALQKLSDSHEYGADENLLRMQGPDGGFHAGYDPHGTYAGTLENAETQSIVILALNSTSTFRLFPILPSWILYVLLGSQQLWVQLWSLSSCWKGGGGSLLKVRSEVSRMRLER